MDSAFHPPRNEDRSFYQGITVFVFVYSKQQAFESAITPRFHSNKIGSVAPNAFLAHAYSFAYRKINFIHVDLALSTSGH
jgi:hypothetical protein